MVSRLHRVGVALINFRDAMRQIYPGRVSLSRSLTYDQSAVIWNGNTMAVRHKTSDRYDANLVLSAAVPS